MGPRCSYREGDGELGDETDGVWSMNSRNHIQLTRFALEKLGASEKVNHSITMYSVWPDLKDRGLERLYFHTYVPGVSEAFPLFGSADERIGDIVRGVSPPTAFSVGLVLHYLQDMAQPFHTSLYELLPSQRLHRTFEDDMDEDFQKIISLLSEGFSAEWPFWEAELTQDTVSLARETARWSSSLASRLVLVMTRMSYGRRDKATEDEYFTIERVVQKKAIQVTIAYLKWVQSVVLLEDMKGGGPFDLDHNHKRIWDRSSKVS